MENISTLTSLKQLYLVNNKINKITEEIGNLKNLKLIELGANRIRVIENIDNLINLESMWIGRNKITNINNLNNLTNLRILSLQANRITVIENLEGLINLEELYLSENGITVIANLDKLNKLKILDLSFNKIKKLENMKTLNLVEFWGNNNLIDNFEEIEGIKHMNNLNTLFLDGNLIAKNVQYRNKLIAMLPSVTCIDSIDVVHSSLTDILQKQ